MKQGLASVSGIPTPDYEPVPAEEVEAIRRVTRQVIEVLQEAIISAKVRALMQQLGLPMPSRADVQLGDKADPRVCSRHE